MGYNEIPVLNGGFAPIDHELTLDLTDIEGEIPKDLTGMYVRNGPNRRFEAPGRYHWFDGDGMLHAVRFANGKAQYQNRWVMTDSLQEELSAGLFGDGHRQYCLALFAHLGTLGNKA